MHFPLKTNSSCETGSIISTSISNDTSQNPELVKHEKLPTPVDYEFIDGYLDGFESDKRKTLNHGFTQGFTVYFQGQEMGSDCDNSMSALDNMEAVDEKLNKELEKGRAGGPFDQKPFSEKIFKCSPLAIREKSKKGTYRLLHNLSFPYNEASVNFNISKEDATVQYSGVSDAIEIIQNLGKGCYMAKCDISEAFRLLPLNPKIYHLFGFKWRGKYFYDKCLPMGCSSSCRLFSTFTDALLFILKEKFGIKNVVKVLDDFIFIEKTEQACKENLEKFIQFCQKAGIPLAPHKTEGPTRCLTFLGVELDTLLMLARLPIDKLQKYSLNIDTLIGSEKVTLRQIRSIVGQLQYSTCVVTPGKAFLRRLINLTIGRKSPSVIFNMSNEAKQDLLMWKQFLLNYNGKSFMYKPSVVDSLKIHLYSDASKLGFGGVYGTSWIQGEWPEHWKKYHISVLEMYPVVALIYTFGVKLKNSEIRYFCDNSAVVEVLNKQSSKDSRIMFLVRMLVLKLLEFNIKIYACHIPGKNNILSDKISRFQVSSKLLSRYNMSVNPVLIPKEIHPKILGIQ